MERERISIPTEYNPTKEKEMPGRLRLFTGIFGPVSAGKTKLIHVIREHWDNSVKAEYIGDHDSLQKMHKVVHQRLHAEDLTPEERERLEQSHYHGYMFADNPQMPGASLVHVNLPFPPNVFSTICDDYYGVFSDDDLLNRIPPEYRQIAEALLRYKDEHWNRSRGVQEKREDAVRAAGHYAKAFALQEHTPLTITDPELIKITYGKQIFAKIKQAMAGYVPYVLEMAGGINDIADLHPGHPAGNVDCSFATLTGLREFQDLLPNINAILYLDADAATLCERSDARVRRGEYTMTIPHLVGGHGKSDFEQIRPNLPPGRVFVLPNSRDRSVFDYPEELSWFISVLFLTPMMVQNYMKSYDTSFVEYCRGYDYNTIPDWEACQLNLLRQSYNSLMERVDKKEGGVIYSTTS